MHCSTKQSLRVGMRTQHHLWICWAAASIFRSFLRTDKIHNCLGLNQPLASRKSVVCNVSIFPFAVLLLVLCWWLLKLTQDMLRPMSFWEISHWREDPSSFELFSIGFMPFDIWIFVALNKEQTMCGICPVRCMIYHVDKAMYQNPLNHEFFISHFWNPDRFQLQLDTVQSMPKQAFWLCGLLNGTVKRVQGLVILRHSLFPLPSSLSSLLQSFLLPFHYPLCFISLSLETSQHRFSGGSFVKGCRKLDSSCKLWQMRGFVLIVSANLYYTTALTRWYTCKKKKQKRNLVSNGDTLVQSHKISIWERELEVSILWFFTPLWEEDSGNSDSHHWHFLPVSNGMPCCYLTLPFWWGWLPLPATASRVWDRIVTITNRHQTIASIACSRRL